MPFTMKTALVAYAMCVSYVIHVENSSLMDRNDYTNANKHHNNNAINERTQYDTIDGRLFVHNSDDVHLILRKPSKNNRFFFGRIIIPCKYLILVLYLSVCCWLYLVLSYYCVFYLSLWSPFVSMKEENVDDDDCFFATHTAMVYAVRAPLGETQCWVIITIIRLHSGSDRLGMSDGEISHLRTNGNLIREALLMALAWTILGGEILFFLIFFFCYGFTFIVAVFRFLVYFYKLHEWMIAVWRCTDGVVVETRAMHVVHGIRFEARHDKYRIFLRIFLLQWTRNLQKK